MFTAGHIPDDQLDLYVMRRFLAVDVAEVEEHLLLCPACQERVEAIDRLMAALRLHRGGSGTSGAVS